jgi:hypothetical protein
MTTGAKHRIGFKQTAVEMIDGSFAQQNVDTASGLLVAGAASVGATATLIVAGNFDRLTVRIANTGSAMVYLGNDDVTAAAGFPLKAGETITIETSSAVYAISATGAVDIRYLELTN